MRRVLMMLLASAPLLSGQFSSLATTDDGSVLYFSTSLRVRGANQFLWQKVFRWDAGGLLLYAQRDRSVPADSFITNHYRMTGVMVSGDGRVVGLQTLADCAIAGSHCFLSEAKEQTEFPSLSRVAPGRGRMSRNGRYATFCCNGTIGAPAGLMDLQTGAMRTFGFVNEPPAVSSSGVTAYPQYDQIEVATMDGRRRIATSASPGQVIVDDAGRAAVYNDLWGATFVARVDLETGVETEIYRGQDVRPIGMSSTGGSVAFLASGQLWMAATDGSGRPRVLTPNAPTITDAVLSGDGAVAYALDAEGRILRIATATGERTVVVGRTLWLPTPLGLSASYGVAGSSMCVGGTALWDASFQIDGRAVPRVDQGCFQVPWAVAPGTHTLTATGLADGPFEAAATGTFEVRAPAFPQFQHWVDGGVPVVVAERSGDHSWVTYQRPARPGEMLDFVMTGLGPVSPAVGDGEPGPVDPPAKVALPFECRASALEDGKGDPVEVVSATLAPGWVGLYRVTLRLPVTVPETDGITHLTCTAGSASATGLMWVGWFTPAGRARRR